MLTCARCGRTSDGRYRFCLGCGAALPHQSPAPPTEVEASSQPIAVDSEADAGPPNAPPPATPPPAAPPPTWKPGSGAVPVSLPKRGSVIATPMPQPAAPMPSGPPSFTPRAPTPPDDDDSLTMAMEPVPLTPQRAPATKDPSLARRTAQKGPRPTPQAPTPVVHDCTSCGTALPPGHLFCGVCGTRMGESPPPTAPATADKNVGHLALIDDLGGLLAPRSSTSRCPSLLCFPSARGTDVPRIDPPHRWYQRR